MAKQYLDSNGLLYFWQKIKAKFNKADLAYDSTNNKITKTIDGTTSDVVTAATLKTAMGLANAEENQNAFSNVKVGNTTIAAGGKTATLELVGSGVTLTPDNTNKKVTFTVQGAAAATEAPLMDGTATVGSSVKYAREDHIHPSDGSRVPTSRTVNGKALTSNIELEAADITYLDNDSVQDAIDSLYAKKFEGVTPVSDIIHYGTCSTAAGTTAKTVALSNFSLVTGARIIVKFTVTNTGAVGSLTLNVNSTGAKNIKYRNGNLPSAGTLAANRFYEFVYDGTYWQLVGDLDTNTTYTASTAAPGKVASASSQGSSTNYARQDHTHGIDLATGDSNGQVKIAGTNVSVKGLAALAYVASLSASDVGAIPTSAKGAASGVCPLNASSKIDSTYLPSYVDDVIEVYARSGQTALSSTWLSETSGGAALTPESGKIYILMADSDPYFTNDQFRWGGTAYVKFADGGISSITNAEIDTIVAS